MRRFIALLFLIVVCGPATKAFAAVVIDFDTTQARVNDGPDTDSDTQTNTGGTIAFASITGYSSTTTSLFNPTIISGNFIHSRVGTLEGYSSGSISVGFTTDADVPYSISGSYSNSDGYTYLSSVLYDGNLIIFQDLQTSDGGPASVTLGGTGTLLAGHSYYWLTGAYTQAFSKADGGATAGGGVSLTIGAAAVPELSSALVWSLLALTIGGAGWWQKRKRCCARAS